LEGLQQQYAESVLFFPAHGQTCHAYCSFCFRWPQFVGSPELRFVAKDMAPLLSHLRRHRQITDVIFTGGDPMVMSTDLLRRYVEPLLAPDLDHVNIRFGTKSLAYWPYRFVSDEDADDLLRLFEAIVTAGRHAAVMAHVSHPRELQTEVVRSAIRRILGTGAVVRCQSPLVKHVNDSPEVWAHMLKEQVRLGLVPYYMFVVRDTGARRYFELPLARALQIYREAYACSSGLCRTLRGPVMSTSAGKIMIEDVVSVGNGPLFALKFVNGRRPEWSNRLFFAEFDAASTWLDDLRPAFGESRFFFEHEPGCERREP
jgi:L-lysine 2,3-aminomutase